MFKKGFLLAKSEKSSSPRQPATTTESSSATTTTSSSSSTATPAAATTATTAAAISTPAESTTTTPSAAACPHAAASKKKSGKKNKDGAKKKARCGLCGKTSNLIKTECCDNWICDDEDNYVMFSYARNSCSRNHRRYTLCGFHFAEGHSGDWKKCKKCEKGFDTETFVYYGTNEYNFEALPNPPTFEPTRCGKCNNVIDLGRDGFSFSGSTHICLNCC